MDVMSVAVAIKETGAKAVESALDALGKSATEATGDLKKMDGMLGGLGSTLAGLAASIGATAIFQRIATETAEAEFATAQLNAALKSTRAVSGQTVQALAEHASALQLLSVYDDDVIAGAQAMLLTFTRISGDTFPKATEAVLNVAQAMGTDLKSAAIQVGKALNDPILGVSALARSGIQFTEAQREMIKQMVETNRLAEAQRIILAELETQFGGSAKAARDTFGGALQALQNDIGNALTLTGQSASLATQLVNYFGTVVRGLRTVVDNFVNLLSLAVTTVTGTLRILKAMELAPEQYAARYTEIANEMSKALETFRGGFDTAKQAGAVYKDAASYFGQLGTTTTQAAGAFDVFSGKVFRATTAVRNFLAGATGKGTTPPVTLSDEERMGGEFNKWFADYQEKKRIIARDAVAARNVQNITRTEAAPPLMQFGLSDAALSGMRAQVRQSAQVAADIVNTELADKIQGIRATFAQGFGTALGAGIAAGFDVALSTKSIGQGFKALTGTILSSFGGMLVQFGTKALIASKAIQGMFKFLFTPGPQSAIAAAAIIAIGAGLQAAGRGILSGTSGPAAPVSAGQFGYTTAGQGGGITLPGISYAPTAAGGMGSRVMAANPVNVTIIGPNDPTAQRQMQELIQNANRRGQTRAV
jgi:hypothetical protein